MADKSMCSFLDIAPKTTDIKSELDDRKLADGAFVSLAKNKRTALSAPAGWKIPMKSPLWNCMGAVRLYWSTPSGLKSPAVSLISSLELEGLNAPSCSGPEYLHICTSGYWFLLAVTALRSAPSWRLVKAPLQVNVSPVTTLNSLSSWFTDKLFVVEIFSARFFKRSCWMNPLVHAVGKDAIILRTNNKN